MSPVVSEFEGYVGRKILPRDVAEQLRLNGVDGAAAIQRLAIAMWESGLQDTHDAVYCYEGAYYKNHTADGTVTSTDRGVWQINDNAHPKVGDDVAYDLEASTVEAVKLGVSQWSSWTKHLSPDAMDAARAAGDVDNVAKALDIWRRAILAYANDQARLHGVAFFAR